MTVRVPWQAGRERGLPAFENGISQADAGSLGRGGHRRMEQISKTTRDRLAAQQNAARQSSAEHIDADMLTAYAENTLAAREREGVMAHLARCTACRELVVLISPDVAELPRHAGAPELA